jgi:hypothetical protein
VPALQVLLVVVQVAFQVLAGGSDGSDGSGDGDSEKKRSGDSDCLN